MSQITKDILKIKAVIFVFALLILALFLPHFHKPIMYKKVAPNVFRLWNYSHTSGGTGFSVISKSGRQYTLTNKHVCLLAVDGNLEAQIDNRFLKVSVIEIYKKHDLCLLTPVPGLESGLKIASLDGAMENGDTEYVIGMPLLRDKVISEGTTGSLGRFNIILSTSLSKEACEKVGAQYMEIDVVMLFFITKINACVMDVVARNSSSIIFPGNSGSPVLNYWGNVVGVIFAGDNEMHHSLYVPLYYVREFMENY